MKVQSKFLSNLVTKWRLCHFNPT